MMKRRTHLWCLYRVFVRVAPLSRKATSRFWDWGWPIEPSPNRFTCGVIPAQSSGESRDQSFVVVLVQTCFHRGILKFLYHTFGESAHTYSTLCRGEGGAVWSQSGSNVVLFHDDTQPTTTNNNNYCNDMCVCLRCADFFLFVLLWLYSTCIYSIYSTYYGVSIGFFCAGLSLCMLILMRHVRRFKWI